MLRPIFQAVVEFTKLAPGTPVKDSGVTILWSLSSPDNPIACTIFAPLVENIAFGLSAFSVAEYLLSTSPGGNNVCWSL